MCPERVANGGMGCMKVSKEGVFQHETDGDGLDGCFDPC